MEKQYTGLNGQQYILDKELGFGGEGAVYTIAGLSDRVAKIYKPEKFAKADRATLERKLKAMLNMNVRAEVDGLLRLAWPQDILYENVVMVGFTMPKVDSSYKIFDMYRTERGRKEQVYPNYTWKYSVQFAYNLAWVVDYVHRQNFVVGDLNQHNIVVDTKTGAVILIDCDSFDIRDPKTQEHFPCGVGLPEILAPELQGQGLLSQKTFTRESDNFSLAIHIFRLLMYNADPFGGTVTMSNVSSSTSSDNAAIINGECTFVRKVPGKEKVYWAPELSVLPTSLQELFRKTFNYTALTARQNISKRAKAGEWVKALAPLGAPEPNANLKRCLKNKRHVYPAHNASCPWCKAEYEQSHPPQPQVKQTPRPQPVKTQQKQPVISQVVQKTTAQVSPAPAALTPRRKPFLFYALAILFGIVSGPCFGQIASDLINEGFSVYIDPVIAALIMAAAGAASGAFLAHKLERRYVCDNNSVPWLLLTLLMFLVPPVIVAAVVLVCALVVLVVQLILGALAIIIIIGALIGGFSGS